MRRRRAEFAALRATGEEALRRVDRKRIVHPTVGNSEADCNSLFGEDGPRGDCRHQPPDKDISATTGHPGIGLDGSLTAATHDGSLTGGTGMSWGIGVLRVSAGVEFGWRFR